MARASSTSQATGARIRTPTRSAWCFPKASSIPLLPSLVTDVALSLAAVRVQQQNKTLTMDTTVSMGQGTTRRTRQQGTIKIDVDPVQAQLDRLSKMRRLSV